MKEEKIDVVYKKVAEWILDSADSCNEVIWLLKRHYKNLNQLTETYSDVLEETNE